VTRAAPGERDSLDGDEAPAIPDVTVTTRRAVPTDLSGGDADPEPAMDREALAWALVFSVPVGVGITGFAVYVMNQGVLNPTAVAVGLATTLVLFSILAYGFSGGSPDEEHEAAE